MTPLATCQKFYRKRKEFEMWKIIEPIKDGDEVVFVGVHAVKWRSEWGEPRVGFVRDNETEQELTALKAENEKLREFVLFLVKLSVNMMYEGNMPTIDEIDALMESSKEWLDEDEWRSYFVS